MEKKNVFGYGLGAITIFFWGITFICTKTLLQDFSALEILFYRFLAAYLFLLIIHPKFEKIPAKEYLLSMFAGLSGVVVYQFSENISLNFTAASNVSVIVAISPLFAALLSQLILKEKHITLWFIIGFIVSIVGVTLVSLNGQSKLEFNPKGDLLALFAAISWGFYSCLISVINRRCYDLICSTRRTFFFAVILMIPLVLIGTRFNGVHSDSGFAESMAVTFDAVVNKARFAKWINIAYILFLGVVASGFCFTGWNKACNLIGTVKISNGLYLIPVVTIVFAYFMLGEKITLMGAIGAVVTIAGLFISGKKSTVNNDKSSKSQN